MILVTITFDGTVVTVIIPSDPSWLASTLIQVIGTMYAIIFMVAIYAIRTPKKIDFDEAIIAKNKEIIDKVGIKDWVTITLSSREVNGKKQFVELNESNEAKIKEIELNLKEKHNRKAEDIRLALRKVTSKGLILGMSFNVVSLIIIQIFPLLNRIFEIIFHIILPVCGLFIFMVYLIPTVHNMMDIYAASPSNSTKGDS